MSSDQHKTMLSEASGYVPEYSAQAHSGSQELAVHGLSSDEVAKHLVEHYAGAPVYGI